MFCENCGLQFFPAAVGLHPLRCHLHASLAAVDQPGHAADCRGVQFARVDAFAGFRPGAFRRFESRVELRPHPEGLGHSRLALDRRQSFSIRLGRPGSRFAHLGLLRLAGVAARVEGEDQALGDPLAAGFGVLGANRSVLPALDSATGGTAPDGGQTSPFPYTDVPGVLCRGALGDCCPGRRSPVHECRNSRFSAGTRPSLERSQPRSSADGFDVHSVGLHRLAPALPDPWPDLAARRSKIPHAAIQKSALALPLTAVLP